MQLSSTAVRLPTGGHSGCRYRRRRRAESLLKEAAARSDRTVCSHPLYRPLHEHPSRAEHRMHVQDRHQGFRPVLEASTGWRRKSGRNRHRRCKSKALRRPTRGEQQVCSSACVQTCMLKESDIPSYTAGCGQNSFLRSIRAHPSRPYRVHGRTIANGKSALEDRPLVQPRRARSGPDRRLQFQRPRTQAPTSHRGSACLLADHQGAAREPTERAMADAKGRVLAGSCRD